MPLNIRLQFRKILGVHKIPVRKIWFLPPPPKSAQNEEKLYKSVGILKVDTFSGGGWGGKRNFMDRNDFMDIFYFVSANSRMREPLACRSAC